VHPLPAARPVKAGIIPKVTGRCAAGEFRAGGTPVPRCEDDEPGSSGIIRREERVADAPYMRRAKTDGRPRLKIRRS
jgi:hypothetical protein